MYKIKINILRIVVVHCRTEFYIYEYKQIRISHKHNKLLGIKKKRNRYW